MNTAKDSPIRLGIVGLGFGMQYMKNDVGPYAHLMDIKAVCDGQPDRLAAGGAAFNCDTYTDLGKMLDEADIEAVALFTGPNGRAGFIHQCLAAGKHVITTKPFELDADAVEPVFAEADRLGLALHLNSPAPVLGKDIAQVNEWVERYQLGQPIFTCFDTWYRAKQKADGSWYDDPKLCPVAPIFRLGIYGINDTLAVVDDDPASLQVMHDRIHTDKPTPDIAQLSVKFKKGTISTFRATWCCGPTRGVQHAEFVFEHGIIRRTALEPDHFAATVTQLKLNRMDEAGRFVEEVVNLPVAESNTAYRWDLFHHAVRGGEVPNRVSPKQIARGIQIIQYMAKAESEGGTVVL